MSETVPNFAQQDMFVAGADTCLATLEWEWVMMELAKHPNTMKKAQEEVKQSKINNMENWT